MKFISYNRDIIKEYLVNKYNMRLKYVDVDKIVSTKNYYNDCIIELDNYFYSKRVEIGKLIKNNDDIILIKKQYHKPLNDNNYQNMPKIMLYQSSVVSTIIKEDDTIYSKYNEKIIKNRYGSDGTFDITEDVHKNLELYYLKIYLDKILGK